MNQWKIFIKTINIMGKRCFLYFLGILFMSIGWSLFAIMTSLLMKNVVDAAENGNATKIPLIIIGNIICGFISLVIYRGAAILYNVEAKRAYANLCKNVFAKEIKLPFSYYEKHHSGEFISKISYDLEKMGSIYSSRLRRAVAPILQVIVYLIPMFILNWQITICFICVNVCMLIINTFLIKPIRDVSKKISNSNRDMTEKMSNLLQGMEQTRMYSAGKETIEEFIKENENFTRQSRKKFLFMALLESSSKGFELVCALAFLIIGIYFTNNEYTTLGSLTAIYSLYGVFSFQFLQLGKYLPELIGCLVNAQNIFDFICEDIEPNCWYEDIKYEDIDNYYVKKKIKAEQEIIIDKIDFSYRKELKLLHNFYMNINKGECVAITGQSGCGKSTISKLLLGLYKVENGMIWIDGQPYLKINNMEIRQKIAYVPQEPYLFNDSIKENIRIGKLNATDEEIENAAKIAHAHEFIMKFENGYETMVGERGNKLSGGERQRIAIARAIIKDAPIILLDEATSALDNESEQFVNESLKSLINKKTIIMIAHRPSTIALADREIIMK
ncbi:ABC transporter ATP-binding protein [Eubacterium sp.]|uniref:ABC transporter ATP-binding protein n=1 Tax=Eubacterium sp. TaxID=142586 RepID=UPI003AF1ABAC